MSPSIDISESAAVIEMKVNPNYFHAGKILHGSIYFKMLDDSGVFCCSVYCERLFVVTSNFNIYFFRPIVEDYLIAKGSVISRSKNIVTVESKLFNSTWKICASGSVRLLKVLWLLKRCGWISNLMKFLFHISIVITFYF